MEYYKEDLRRYSLREFLSNYSVNTLLGAILWFLMKIYLIRPQNKPFAVCRSFMEKQVDLDQIPERYQPDISKELKILDEAGFIEPQLLKLNSGPIKDDSKLPGITIYALHQDKVMGISFVIYFPDETESFRSSYYIVSFPDSTSSITTSDQRNLIDLEPGDAASCDPDATLTELIQIHQQRLAELNESCLTIENGEELLQLFEDRENRKFDYDIKRGVMKRVDPS